MRRSNFTVPSWTIRRPLSRLHTGSKCKASKEKITAGEIRLCARVGSAAELEANAGEKAKMYYNPMAIKPFWRAYHEATGVRPSDIAGAELLDEAYHKALLDANEDERYEEADC